MKNKNFYDWLEINRNASPEVIEKAYKTLVKKYHPDLQEESQKANSEEILKHITDAYSTLSDPVKKEEYDNNLQQFEISQEDYQNLYQEKANLENELNNLKNNQYHQNPPVPTPQQPLQQGSFYTQEYQHQPNLEEQRHYQEQMNQAIHKAYHDAYVQELKNRGFKIRYKKSLKDYIRILITFLVIIVIIFLLGKIPFTRDFFINLYEQNSLVKIVVDILSSLLNAIFSAFK